MLSSINWSRLINLKYCLFELCLYLICKCIKRMRCCITWLSLDISTVVSHDQSPATVSENMQDQVLIIVHFGCSVRNSLSSSISNYTGNQIMNHSFHWLFPPQDKCDNVVSSLVLSLIRLLSFNYLLIMYFVMMHFQITKHCVNALRENTADFHVRKSVTNK